MSCILTLDVGTTAIKGALFNTGGQMVCLSVHEYQLDTPSLDIVELEAETYWSAAQAVIADILKRSEVAPEKITCLGITSQGETLIALDQHGRPLRKAIVWLDNRAKAEAEAIRQAFGRELTYRVTGQQDVVPGWPAAKILWLRNHERDVFDAAGKFLMVEDYLIYRLTGNFATDHALNPSTLYYDLPRGCWWEDMLGFLGISSDQLPSLLSSGAPAGQIAAETGLGRHTVVTVAPIDQVAAAVGTGNIAPGAVTEITGAALALCASVERPVYDPAMRLGLYRHAMPGLFVLLPWIPTAGMILRWFRDEFGEGRNYTELVAQAASVPAGNDGLILLPHFCGMNSPDVNPNAKGVFWGISTSHRQAHFIRAIMEAVAFALRDNLELLQQCGIDCRKITSVGGAARSQLWLQIKADVLQHEINTTQCEEITSLGAAVLAAAGSGMFPDIPSAVAAMVHPAATISPDIQNREVYEAAFQTYRELNRKNFSHSCREAGLPGGDIGRVPC